MIILNHQPKAEQVLRCARTPEERILRQTGVDLRRRTAQQRLHDELHEREVQRLARCDANMRFIFSR